MSKPIRLVPRSQSGCVVTLITVIGKAVAIYAATQGVRPR